ncbi:hypothetical protein GE21DRAFT_1306860 [Neurospora crassa]|nr:hypothetical protein GE21DRAFT_1306860 [Neurospora crassa]
MPAANLLRTSGMSQHPAPPHSVRIHQPRIFARLRVTVPRLYPTIRLGLFLMKESDSNVTADNGGDPRRLRTLY